MTEQIKSALEVLGTYDMSEDNDDTEFKDSIALAINSLNAWSEVLNECYEEQDRAYKRYCVFPTESDSATYDAYTNVIDIINQHLSEIGEG